MHHRFAVADAWAAQEMALGRSAPFYEKDIHVSGLMRLIATTEFLVLALSQPVFIRLTRSAFAGLPDCVYYI